MLEIKNKLKSVVLQMKSTRILDILWVGFFNKTIIPPALTGYEMVDSQLGALSTLSYLTRTRGIIVLN